MKNSLDIHSLPWGARCDNIKQCFEKYRCFLVAHYRNKVGGGIRLLSSLPRLWFSSNLGDFAVNTIGKDEVLPHANALIVSSGTVQYCAKRMQTNFVEFRLLFSRNFAEISVGKV